MPLIDPESLPLVDTAFQNDDHRAEAVLINQCVEVLDQGGDATSLIKHLADHTVAHFAREDEAMRRTGFPAFAMHAGEHERVLKDFGAQAEALQGQALRQWLENELTPWFINHIATMDRVTAHWLRQHHLE